MLFRSNVIENSIGKDKIMMSSDMWEIVSRLRAFMFKNVYLDERAKRESVKVDHMIKGLYGYYTQHTEEMEPEFISLIEMGEPKEKAVCDYIACMTDRYAIKMYTDRFIPSSWNIY